MGNRSSKSYNRNHSHDIHSHDIHSRKLVVTDDCDKIVCNVFEFLDWCKDVGVMKKHRYISIARVEKYVNYFIAYQSCINIFGVEDTVQERRRWFRENQSKIIELSLAMHL